MTVTLPSADVTSCTPSTDVSSEPPSVTAYSLSAGSTMSAVVLTGTSTVSDRSSPVFVQSVSIAP